MTDRYTKNTFDRLPRYFRQRDDDGAGQNFFDAFDLDLAKWDTRLNEVESARDVDRISLEEIRYKAANLGAELPDFFPSANRRKWLQNIVPFWKAKGSHQNIANAIRTVLGLAANIHAPWNTNCWTVGTSTVGIDTLVCVGGVPAYISPHPDHWEVGSGLVGSMRVGQHGVNPSWPRTFCISLLRVPTADELEAVRYLALLLKAAEEHFKILIPSVGRCWIVAASDLGIDTTLCQNCWQVGISTVGVSTVVCSTTQTAAFVLTADATLGGVTPPLGDPPTESPWDTGFTCDTPPLGDPPSEVPFIICDGTIEQSFLGVNGLVVTTVDQVVP